MFKAAALVEPTIDTKNHHHPKPTTTTIIKTVPSLLVATIKARNTMRIKGSTARMPKAPKCTVQKRNSVFLPDFNNCVLNTKKDWRLWKKDTVVKWSNCPTVRKHRTSTTMLIWKGQWMKWMPCGNV